MTDSARLERYIHALEFAEKQVAQLVEKYPDFFPIYTVNGKWHHEGELWTDWTGGFLAGMMWRFHERTGDSSWFLRQTTHQGLSDHSRWARGLAWCTGTAKSTL